MGDLFLAFLVIVFFYSILSSLFEFLFGSNEKKQEVKQTVTNKSNIYNQHYNNECLRLKKEWRINKKLPNLYQSTLSNCHDLAKEILRYYKSINKSISIRFNNFDYEKLKNDAELVKLIFDSGSYAYYDVYRGYYNSLLLDLSVAEYVIKTKKIYFYQLPNKVKGNKNLAMIGLKMESKMSSRHRPVWTEMHQALKSDLDVLKVAIENSDLKITDVPASVIENCNDDFFKYILDYYPPTTIYKSFNLSNEQKLMILEKDINFFINLNNEDKKDTLILNYLRNNYNLLSSTEKELSSEYLDEDVQISNDITVSIDYISRLTFQIWLNNQIIESIIVFDTYDFLEISKKGKKINYKKNIEKSNSISEYLSSSMDDWDYVDLVKEDGSCLGNMKVKHNKQINIKLKEIIYNESKLYDSIINVEGKLLDINGLFVKGLEKIEEKKIYIKERINKK